MSEALEALSELLSREPAASTGSGNGGAGDGSPPAGDQNPPVDPWADAPPWATALRDTVKPPTEPPKSEPKPPKKPDAPPRETHPYTRTLRMPWQRKES